MNDIKIDKIWEEVNSVIKERRGGKLPGEKTLAELMNDWGMTRDRVRAITKVLVDEKLFLKRKIGSSKTLLFRPDLSIENFAERLRELIKF